MSRGVRVTYELVDRLNKPNPYAVYYEVDDGPRMLYCRADSAPEVDRRMAEARRELGTRYNIRYP